MSLRDAIIVEMQAAMKVSGIKLQPYDCGVLADAALDALRPHDGVKDAKPVVLYFHTDEEREEFIEAVHEACPNLRSVKV